VKCDPDCGYDDRFTGAWRTELVRFRTYRCKILSVRHMLSFIQRSYDAVQYRPLRPSLKAFVCRQRRLVEHDSGRRAGENRCPERWKYRMVTTTCVGEGAKRVGHISRMYDVHSYILVGGPYSLKDLSSMSSLEYRLELDDGTVLDLSCVSAGSQLSRLLD